MNAENAALVRLNNHAGGDGLGEHLYLVDENGASLNLALLDDVVACLDALNTEYNGPDPKTRPVPRAGPIPETVSYSVARIIDTCLRYYRSWSAAGRFSHDVLGSMLTGIHKIAFCWAQLLASDITDLTEGFDWV